MTKAELSLLEPNKRAEWLNSASAFSRWKAGDDVFCLHCDAVFKAEDVSCKDDAPTCPACGISTAFHFHPIPWWRRDLVAEDNEGRRYWLAERIVAEPGKPRRMR